MTRKRLWMNRISGIVCLLLWIAFIIFLSGTTGKIAGMALGIMLLVAVIYNLYLPKEVSTHLKNPAPYTARCNARGGVLLQMIFLRRECLVDEHRAQRVCDGADVTAQQLGDGKADVGDVGQRHRDRKSVV